MSVLFHARQEQRRPVSASRALRALIALLGVLSLSACGGGGGGDSADLVLDTTSIRFEALQSGTSFEYRDVSVSWLGSEVAGIVAGVPPGSALPGWLSLELLGDSRPLTLRVHRGPSSLSPGKHSVQLRVVTLDVNERPIDIVDFPVSLDLVALPSITPLSVSWSAVESEPPSPTSLQLNRDSRVGVTLSTDQPWLGSTLAGSIVTIAPTASAASLGGGAYQGKVLASYHFGDDQAHREIPVNLTVASALVGAPPAAFQVGASTTAGQLVDHSIGISARTSRPISWTASSGAPWLRMTTSTGTTSAGGLTFDIDRNALSGMSNGDYSTQLTVKATDGSVVPIQIPVTLSLRLPEFTQVMPVAFERPEAGDYVIARGDGLDDPATAVLLDGQPATILRQVSPTEVHLDTGVRTPGSYVLSATNRLGLSRGTTSMRVATLTSYTDFDMSRSMALAESLVFSNVHRSLYSVVCYFCTITPGTTSVIHRFRHVATSGNWIHSEHPIANLVDAALSPQEDLLIVLTRSTLLLLDPATLAEKKRVALPFDLGGGSRQLAVLNNGLILINELGRAYSLASNQFVSIPGIAEGDGIAASRDGSKALFGVATNDGGAPYRYVDASSNDIITTTTRQHYARGVLDRHATRAMVNHYVLDANFVQQGSLPNLGSHSGGLTPDGNRAYIYDVNNSSVSVYSFLGGFYSTLPSVAVPRQGAGRLIVDPSGRAFMLVTTDGFSVRAIPP